MVLFRFSSLPPQSVFQSAQHSPNNHAKRVFVQLAPRQACPVSIQNIYKKCVQKKNQRKLHWITCVSPAFPYVTTCNVSSIRTLLTPLGTLTSIYHQPGSLQGGRRHQTLESPHGTRATCTPKTHFRMTTYIQHDFQGVHLMGPVRNSSSSQPA